MLLRTRIKFPSLKKRPKVLKPKSVKRPRSNSNRRLPYEIQEIICSMVLGDNAANPFALTAMRVCKAWANFICERLYRQFQFGNYIQFIGFVNTISLKNTVLPYGKFVRHIDLTTVNKYGVDSRVRRLIRSCPNIVSITLGNSMSVKADTLQLMGRYCHSVHTLQMGGMQSFPFMFNCDFSGMLGLRILSLYMTPLQSSSLNTIPITVKHLKISHMDALQHDEFETFLQGHSMLESLSVRRCRHLNKSFASLIGGLPKLDMLELAGPEINDDGLKDMFHSNVQLSTLKLCHTQISNATLEALATGRMVVQCLDISNNTQITQSGVDALLRKKKFEQFTCNL